ncbi:putative L-ascorbate peroxidase 6 isoform X2 [Corylus avellana]|uniref:putative L-ascorbate peroxidase 6 isoform X2 n=1 Tax=Corylus avellana TaxID=13451 RepID=UPI00286A681F|nr:putative L-ascorbate peroxidase 6 isoform X2 [Corylus avellana]
MTSSATLFHFKPSLLHCSASTASSSHSLSLKFIFPARPQRPLFPTVQIQSRPSTPRASSRTFVATENDSGSARDLFCASISSRRKALAFVATLPCLLLLNESSMAGLATSEYMLLKEEVRKVLSKGKAAGVLRLVFHDAGTFDMDENSGGMNGSVVYELDRPENAGLQKPMKTLEKAKTEVDAIQPVSWADMIAVAGAEAVSLCGGPTIPVLLGRLDSVEPDPEGKLPQESLDAPGLKQCFQRKGLTTQDLVALSGAHTLGSKGFGNPTVFDNSYFKILLQKPWMSSGGMSSMVGLPSDRALTEDDECLRWITKYAESQNMFFEDFKNAYIKLVNSGAKWKSL